MEYIIGVTPYLIKGIQLTFIITVVVVFIIGTFAGMGRLAKNKLVFWISTIYVEVIRGTPILVQILFLYFGVSDLLNLDLDKISASIIAIAINAGAYVAEIVRGGIQAI